jgi:CubicO group peptidase (beta-lactamase class C family)
VLGVLLARATGLPFGDGAAGLVSTAEDLLRFARMLLRGGAPVLTEDAVTEMTRNQLTPEQQARDGKGVLEGRSWGFCQSVVIDGPHAGAFGWDGVPRPRPGQPSWPGAVCLT